MASMQHEGLLLLFQNRPSLAAELLSDMLGLRLPAWSEARVDSAQLTEVVPTEYRADLVVLLLEGKPVFAIVVEVQLGRDEGKRKSWPQYLTSLRSRLDCPCVLLVVAPDVAVARWCARPIELGHPGFVLKPLVAGPDAIPVLTDEQVARQEPELAVLSALAHGHEEVGGAIAHTVMAAVEGLDGERARLYVDLMLSSLNEAARSALEDLMQRGTYEYQSDFARKYVAQGRQEGLQEGRQEGLQEGRQEGLQEGLQALLEVLEARGLLVDAEARQRILACTGFPQLKQWLLQAVTVRSAQELFAPPAPRPPVRKAGKPARSRPARKAPSKR